MKKTVVGTKRIWKAPRLHVTTTALNYFDLGNSPGTTEYSGGAKARKETTTGVNTGACDAGVREQRRRSRHQKLPSKKSLARESA